MNEATGLFFFGTGLTAGAGAFFGINIVSAILVPCSTPRGIDFANAAKDIFASLAAGVMGTLFILLGAFSLNSEEPTAILLMFTVVSIGFFLISGFISSSMMLNKTRKAIGEQALAEYRQQQASASAG